MGRINQLPASATLNSTDVIAVDAGTGGTTNKMTATNLANGLKTLGNYQDKLTFDYTPTASSTNPVTSGGVKTALDGKQNTLTFDSTPTAGSNNPVTSGGIATAIQQSKASFSRCFFNGRYSPGRASVQVPWAPTNWSCGIFLVNINGFGNMIGYVNFAGSNTGAITVWLGSNTQLSATYGNSEVTFTATNYTIASITTICI